jgi:SAM-dependent methyltransferase
VATALKNAAQPHAGAVPAEYADLAEFFDRFAQDEPRWRRRNRTYYRLLEQIHRFQIPPGARVLEIGSGSGDLLAGLRPSYGVGVDVSEKMVELARGRHPELRFEVAAGEQLELGETFDYIVLSDLMPFVHDLLALFQRLQECSHERTRIVIHSYSRVWRPAVRLAEWLRLKPRKPLRNWVSPQDVRNLLELSGFEVVTRSSRILLPKYVPLLTWFLNAVLANVWPFHYVCLTYWLVARPASRGTRERSVSVVCAVRNEEGHIPELVARLPEVGTATELVFVEGGSTDDTRGAIEREIERHPELAISMLSQPGRGKGDAVRTGFAEAKHDVLMILDGDLSVRPEDLPKFYEALVQNRGELINGSRLVYDMEPGSMRFFNVLGNKFFSMLFGAITGQDAKDTLCGTKVLLRSDYERIAAARSYFGEFDPFGDFDLLFGAARLNLKIVDLPVRYQPRTYGETNISRWSHGVLLMRMALFAFWKFKLAPYSRRSRRLSRQVL